MEATMNATDNRFSRNNFGGGEAGERLANEALAAHERLLVPGARVRIYRGNGVGEVGLIEDREAGGRNVYVQTADGLHWTVETRNLEIVAGVLDG